MKRSLWIGTADIKDLYVEERPFLGLLADLIKKGKEVRLIHAKEPGPNFREDFDLCFFSLRKILIRYLPALRKMLAIIFYRSREVNKERLSLSFTFIHFFRDSVRE